MVTTAKSTKMYGVRCPICETNSFTLLTRVWRNYHRPADFHIDPIRWFAECDQCATVVMLPLFDDFDSGGTVYYDQKDIDAHTRHHFESFQRPNYDNVRAFMQKATPAGQFRRWLDVGSVGYPTTFDDYEFTTIEPDVRAAQAGERMFRSGRIHGATIDRWRTETPYDGILFNNSFYCLADPGAALEHAATLLRAGGRLIVTNSSNFSGAISDYEDGRVLHLEGLIFGETVQVFYNVDNLTYLAARHGFRLIEVADVKAYRCKTMKVSVFEWDGVRRTLPELLERSRRQQHAVWQRTFDDFEASISATLDAIDVPEMVLAGSLDVIADLNRRRPFQKIRGIVPFPESHLAGASVNGLRVLSWKDLVDLETDDYQVAVCSFKDASGVAAAVRQALGDDVQLLAPTRCSGMEAIDIEFKGQRRPSKGMALRPLPRGQRRVSVEGRRVLIYGAGAGGREAIDRITAGGGEVAAICDGDSTKQGTVIFGRAICGFDQVDRSAFDLVVVASRPGYPAIAERLSLAGLRAEREFVAIDHLR